MRVTILGRLGRQEYEVSLERNGDHVVQAVQQRKALARGYSYAPGKDVILRTVKAHGSAWNNAVFAAYKAANALRY